MLSVVTPCDGIMWSAVFGCIHKPHFVQQVLSIVQCSACCTHIVHVAYILHIWDAVKRVMVLLSFFVDFLFVKCLLSNSLGAWFFFFLIVFCEWKLKAQGEIAFRFLFPFFVAHLPIHRFDKEVICWATNIMCLSYAVRTFQRAAILQSMAL